MRGSTVEYQRFGDPTGIIRLSDRYIRTVGPTDPAEEVGFDITQENLDAGMKSLDYKNFERAPGKADDVRRTAEQFIKDITPHLKRFLLTKKLSTRGKGPHQIDVVTRALELAQLPFEILEQTHPKLVITRRVRQAWPPPPVVRKNVPRVLFAWAEPKQRPGSRKRMDVPHERHRGLLDALLKDWGEQAIVEVPNATREKLTLALKESQKAPPGKDRRFTHVHLLAHGIGPDAWATKPGETIDLTRPPSPSTLLALEHDDGMLDRCTPNDFATIFEEVPRPETFALATCHSGEVDSARSGATLAHVLHAAGVPVVLASQLALTKDGSDQLIQTFLAGVIEGQDPRETLRACRDILAASAETTYYDRVALVGYVHVEQGIAERMKERRFNVAMARLKAISKDARDRVKQAVGDLRASKGITDQQRAEAEAIRRRFDSVRAKLAELEPDHTLTKAQLEELRGLQGSSSKREAEEAWRLSGVLSKDESKEWLELSHQSLLAAADAYQRAAELSRDHHWSWLQWLVLDAVHRGSLVDREEDWIVAMAAARDAVNHKATSDATKAERIRIAEDAVWGWGSMCELNLLAPLVGRGDQLAEAKACLDALLKATRKLKDDFPITSTLDQFARYENWWGADAHWKLPADVVAQAKELHDYLTTKNRNK